MPQRWRRPSASGQVTFFSRSKQRLWTKGESSGHVLALKSIRIDCDADTLAGPGRSARPDLPPRHVQLLRRQRRRAPAARLPRRLDALVAQRHARAPAGSYTTRLFDGGIRRIAQKVGEEGVETALAAVAQDDEELLGEAADLMFHLTVVLRARGLSLGDVVGVLAERRRPGSCDSELPKYTLMVIVLTTRAVEFKRQASQPHQSHHVATNRFLQLWPASRSGDHRAVASVGVSLSCLSASNRQRVRGASPVRKGSHVHQRNEYRIRARW